MAKVRVVLSWSGQTSREVALLLRDWLRRVIQGVDPWMSETDIPAGASWLHELQRALADSRFGILCLTPGNLEASWLQFEAGVMWKAFEENRVCPFLVGVGIADVKQPLGVFQACGSANEDDVFRMMKSIKFCTRRGGPAFGGGAVEQLPD